MTTPMTSNTLAVNVFTAPGKPMVGERPRPFGEALGFDPMASTLIFGERDAVLVDALTTVAEAEALADWVALHHRNLRIIYITHGHADHFYGLSVLLGRFPNARAIATPNSVEEMASFWFPRWTRSWTGAGLGSWPRSWSLLSPMRTTRSLSRATKSASSSRATPMVPIRRLCTFRRSTWSSLATGVQPVPHVRRRHHPRKPEELGRGAGPVGSAEAGDCRC